ncbi:MAG TPA: hypothetical protein PK733_01885 [Clostridiales bacterium]|nr:hypothetical protein [Clostridiales bacterium]
MDSYTKKLEYLGSLANGIYAAAEIYNIMKLNESDSNKKKPYSKDENNQYRRSVNPSTTAMYNDVLIAIAKYLPEASYRKNNLRKSLDKSILYGNTYKQLKDNMTSLRVDGMDKNKLINTLSIVKPLLNGERADIVDKFLKIYDIINS